MGSGARRSGRIRRRTAPGPKLGDDDDGGCSGPFWSCETARRTRAEQRSFGRRRGGETVAVAPVTASAAMGSARARAGREAEEGTGSRGREGRCRGRGEVRGVRGRLGNASVEAGGGRGGIGARHRAASVRGEEEDKGEEVGWAARWGSWAGYR